MANILKYKEPLNGGGGPFLFYLPQKDVFYSSLVLGRRQV
jgi:hypothetical protein